MAEAAISSGKKQFVILMDDPTTSDLVRIRLREHMQEVDAAADDEREGTVAIVPFNSLHNRPESRYGSIIYLIHNPLVRWPLRMRQKYLSDWVGLKREIGKSRREIEMAGSGRPMYFALVILADLLRKSTYLHFLVKDLSHRMVATKGPLSGLSALLIMRVK